jgi:SAM-dependent methyltransferase/uncharacterized protein YbaR (Trm112 family)
MGTESVTPTVSAGLEPILLEMIVCPRDKQRLHEDSANQLSCSNRHHYRVIDGVPILLVSDAPQTHIEGDRSLQLVGNAAIVPQIRVGEGEVDPFVRNAIGATNGAFYQHLVGNLADYPIPHLRLPAGNGARFLEIGCSWGRWCIAAARKGYRPIGIDPSLKGIRSARRVARQLGIDALYLVADGRYLPFPDSSFDQVFSYSVLQHFSKNDVRLVLPEIRRVLRIGGQSQIQMPNVFGARSLYHQIRRRFRTARDFEVRYWTPGELLEIFNETVGHATISVDGFFSLNPQISDIRFLPKRYRAIVYASEALRRMSAVLPPLTYTADSLYVTAARPH